MSSTPVRLDMKIVVPSTLRVDTNLLRMSANADLSLQGTLDRPVLLGHADIVDRGEVNFEGRRYRITRGSIDFSNLNRIEPFFDVEMETTVRVLDPAVRRPRPIASSSAAQARALDWCRRSALNRRCRRPTCWRFC